MERIRINLPDSFSFSTNIQIRITDVNYGGHVGNDSFLSLVHEARLQFLASRGFSEMDIMGVGLIMADAGIEFKKEMAYGDMVKISVAATNFDRIGFDLFYLLEVEKDGVTTIAGKAKTGMMCFDYTNKKKAAIPAAAIKLLQSI
jgi:YbgC/YbaW family acyl-CoA thioester hydrolase